MKRRFVASFLHQDDILGAVKAFRELGFEIEDAYTPYAVHGLDQAAGVRPSRLGYFCAVIGLTAAALGLYFQHWVSAVAWPLNIGGKPLSSIPAFIPVTFEIGVLVAGVGTVLAFLVVSRLYPGKRVRPVDMGITTDRFVVVLAAGTQEFAGDKAVQVAERFHAVETRTVRQSGFGSGRGIEQEERAGPWRCLNGALAAALFALAGATYLIGPRSEHRGTEFLPEMIEPVAAESFAANSQLASARALQRPPAGAISRAAANLESHLEPGPEGAARAAVALHSPWQEANEDEVTRGATVYQTYCQLCHGPAALGDGPVAQRGFPAPPSLLADNALALADGQIFHIITTGQNNMPAHGSQIDPLDRWRAVLWVRRLQEPAAATADSEAGAEDLVMGVAEPEDPGPESSPEGSAQ